MSCTIPGSFCNNWEKSVYIKPMRFDHQFLETVESLTVQSASQELTKALSHMAHGTKKKL